MKKLILMITCLFAFSSNLFAQEFLLMEQGTAHWAIHKDTNDAYANGTIYEVKPFRRNTWISDISKFSYSEQVDAAGINMEYLNEPSVFFESFNFLFKKKKTAREMSYVINERIADEMQIRGFKVLNSTIKFNKLNCNRVDKHKKLDCFGTYESKVILSFDK